MLRKPDYSMIKKVNVQESNGSMYTLTFKYSAKTYLFYKNFYNRDLMQDYIIAVTNDGKNLNNTYLMSLNKSIEESKNLTPDQYNHLIKQLDASKFISFLENLIPILFYTANEYEGLTLEEIKEEYLPPNYVFNDDIINAVGDILNTKINKDLEKKTKSLK